MNATKNGKRDEYLTNTSEGKLSSLLSNLTWTFNKLWRHIDAQGVSSRRVRTHMHNAIAATLLLGEPRFKAWTAHNSNGIKCAGCYQLLGVDVLFDNQWKPHVIEVNGLPSMQLSDTQTEAINTTSSYTLRKLLLAADIVSLLFRPRSVAEHVPEQLVKAGVGISVGGLCNKRIHRACVSLDEVWCMHLCRLFHVCFSSILH